MKKNEFDFGAQIDESKSRFDQNTHLDKASLERKYVKLVHELMYHLYMAYDLINLCKLITNFKYVHKIFGRKIKIKSHRSPFFFYPN